MSWEEDGDDYGDFLLDMELARLDEEVEMPRSAMSPSRHAPFQPSQHEEPPQPVDSPLGPESEEALPLVQVPEEPSGPKVACTAHYQAVKAYILCQRHSLRAPRALTLAMEEWGVSSSRELIDHIDARLRAHSPEAARDYLSRVFEAEDVAGEAEDVEDVSGEVEDVGSNVVREPDAKRRRIFGKSAPPSWFLQLGVPDLVLGY